jgi:hypothetical protein
MKIRSLLAIVAGCLALAFAAAPASAQATRTWVSPTGSDGNPCTRTAPCATFAGAIVNTVAGGEINCIDAGGYGTVTITQSITIDCGGNYGSILASGAPGVTVNGANIVVILRNLSINGAPPNNPGTYGVRIVAAAQVNIENVRIQGFRNATTGFGVSAVQSSGNLNLYITSSIISHNGSGTSAGGGVQAAPTGSGSVALFLDDVDFNNNSRGLIFANAGTSATTSGLTMNNSTVFRNLGGGLVLSSGANTLKVMVEDVTVDANGTGISMNGAGVSLDIGGSVIMFNGTAIINTGGTLRSFKNNQIDLNGNNSTPITGVNPE